MDGSLSYEQHYCKCYHRGLKISSTNGLAERHVQTFKHMYQSCPDKGTVQHKVGDVLFRNRNTPHTTTGKTPSQLFLKWEPRTHLSLVKPSLQRHVEKKHLAPKLYKDGLNPKGRMFDLYQPVRVKTPRGKGEMDTGYNCGCERTRNLSSSNSR